MIYQFLVSFVIGIIFEFIFSAGLAFSLLVVLVSFCIFLILFSQNDDTDIAKKILIIGLAFSLGILRMSLAQNLPDSNLYKMVGQKISFEATIIDEPDVRDTSARYTVKPTLSSKSLVLLITDRFPEYKYGDKIKVSGKLDLPKNFTSDNGTEFDYISYLSKDQIHFLIYRPEIEKLEGNNGNKIIANLYSLKNIFIEKISNVVPEPNSSLLGGLIFGAKQSLGTELLDDFRKVGLIHIVVLSGYNITIIAVGIFYLTSFLGRRKLGFVIGAVSILLFAIMVGLGATVIRACIMSLISILAVYLGRPADALRFLFIAGLLIKMSGFVSLISFLVNPLVLPLVPWAMAFGALTGAIGIFSQMLSWPFGVISYFISQIMISITEFSASLPLATLQTGSISLWFIFAWYLGYGVLYWKLKNLTP